MAAAVKQSSMSSALSQASVQDVYLSTLPSGFMPFEDFKKEFALGGTSTEQFHPKTKYLSQVMHRNIEEGMELLLDVDEGVVDGLRAFLPTIETIAPKLAERIKQVEGCFS